MAEILNKARYEGSFGETDPVAVWVETELTVETINLTITKTANRELWGNDELTYTVRVTNNETTAVNGGALIDTLDFNSVNLVADSVMVDGVLRTYTYTEATGVLRVDLGVLAAGETVEITFRVTKKP